MTIRMMDSDNPYDEENGLKQAHKETKSLLLCRNEFVTACLHIFPLFDVGEVNGFSAEVASDIVKKINS